MSNQNMKTVLMVIGILLLLFLGYTVWPTPYRYDHLGEIIVRIHRVSGMAEYLGGSGWQKMEDR